LKELNELQSFLARMYKTVVAPNINLNWIARCRPLERCVDTACADRRDAEFAHLLTSDATSQAPVMNVVA